MTNAIDQLKSTLQSEQFKKILPYLLIGGTAATAGAYMTGERRKNRRRPESRMGYLGRVLRNALVTGGLAAGAAGLARYGSDKLSGKAVQQGFQPPGVDNPTDQALRSTLFSPVTALGAGAAGLWGTHKLPGIGADTKSRDAMLKVVADAVGGKDPADVRGWKPDVLRNEMSAAVSRYYDAMRKYRNYSGPAKDAPPLPTNPFVGGMEDAARRAGLTLGNTHRPGKLLNANLMSTLKKIIKSPGNAKHELDLLGDRVSTSEVGEAVKNVGKTIRQGVQKVQGPNGKTRLDISGLKHVPGSIMHELELLKRMPGTKYRTGQLRELGSRMTRRGILSTFGQTGGRRAGRAGVALAAASIPALIGAFTTDEKQN